MRVTALEINDAGILAMRTDRTMFESPGFALLDERGIVVGQEAERRARLQPRLVNHRFWDQLDTAPVHSPSRLTVSSSDLVSLHLESLWQQLRPDTDQLILVVPGCYSTAQLGLLLGIAQQLSIPVGGIVDSAVAVTPANTGPSTCYLDIHLHKLTVTTVDPSADVKRCRTKALTEWGLHSLYERWQRLIRDEFIRTTRFDPLYSAQSEQTLVDQLPRWLSALQTRASTEVVLGSQDGRAHSIALASEPLICAVQGFYETVSTTAREHAAKHGMVLQLSHRLGGLPGLRQMLGETFEDIRVLPRGAAAKGALEHANTILHNGPTTLTDHLPDAPPTRTVTMQPPARPTHLLHAGLAYPLRTDTRHALRLTDADQLSITYEDDVGDGDCVLGVTDQQVTVFNRARSPLYLNGASINRPTLLSIGDTLTFENARSELRLIAVMDE